MPPRVVMLVFGTRPEAIKLAPVIQVLQADARYQPVVVVTAQHREMLDQVLSLFAITPDFDLGIQRDRQSLASITTRALEGLDPVMADQRPDLVVVQGDTTTTFVGALAGFYHRIPVAHVEAGLRTGDPYAPYPEEINRRLTSQLASLHLAPTPASVANLRAEGIAPDVIVCTGNTVIDALHWAVDRRVDYGVAELARLDADPRRLLLVTVHRRESWGTQMEGVARAVARLAAANRDLLTVIPMHKNPVVREALLPVLSGLDNVIVVEPLPYGAFCRLLERSDLVITDSGGVQEEAPSLGKPVLVLRHVTERPEAVAAGTVELVGTDEERIVARGQTLLSDAGAYARMAHAVNPYGDGRAAARTLDAITWLFGDGGRPQEFRPPEPPPEPASASP
ncbi:MAG: non-hydrolyzing UDP-N-acetylglucosamine 2-epimerase [Acidimicrobiales bacterium]